MIKLINKKSALYNTRVLSQLLSDLYNDFKPALSSRTNLIEWVKKLDYHANITMAFDKDRPIGLIAYYCNDLSSKVTYISLLGMLSEYRGQGIAIKLLKICIEKSKEVGMENVIVKTESVNLKAIKFYEKMGFKKICWLLEHDVKKVKLRLDL